MDLEGVPVEIPIIGILRAVEEKNKACEMALKYAAPILKDFKDLNPCGRIMIAAPLMELITGGPPPPTDQEGAEQHF